MKASFGTLNACILSLFIIQESTGFLAGARSRRRSVTSPWREMSRERDDPKDLPPGISRRKLVEASFIFTTAANSLLNPFYQPAKAAVWSSSVRKYNPNIPFSSVRSYKTLTLLNGLRVLLVSDSRASRSGAALTVGGAGQFAQYTDLPGCSHLLEHMILSYDSKSRLKESKDFEEWLSDKEGSSNAFTAYDTVCFHFNCPQIHFGEALERFATLFVQEDVENICRNKNTLKREVRRVDSELDFDEQAAYYVSKSFVNPEHPYSTFTAGDLQTLERLPAEADIDVSERLIDFFRSKYQPQHAVLVVLSPLDMFTLERSIYPFSSTLSKAKVPLASTSLKYPGGFLQGNRLKHVVVARKSGSDTERLSMQWALALDYTSMQSYGKETVTATQIAFALSQIVGRRGPGSLYQYLRRRDWIPAGITYVPRISIPVDVSGFQIISLDMTLTLDGFLSRATVVSTVYECIESLRMNGAFQLSRELLAQYASVAKIQGYLLAPRPPDAVELAVDAQLYGLGDNRPGSGQWYLFPEPNDNTAINNLQKMLIKTLTEQISDPAQAVIIATAGPRALAKELKKKSISPDAVDWKIEPVSGARFVFDDMLPLNARFETAVLTKFVAENELAPTFTNPLVPTNIRVPRMNIDDVLSSTAIEKENGKSFRVLRVYPVESDSWIVLDSALGQPVLPLPRGPPEPSCRSAFVLELLSPRPARANIRQAAQGELWKLSFETAASDIAELGVPGGLAYELSYNKYGLRISFIGISQNLPSYARRICRRLVEHQYNLLAGSEFFPSSLTAMAVTSAQRAPGISPDRRRRIISSLRRSTAYEAAAEGTAFLKSCTGAVCFSQGDFTRQETEELKCALKEIFSDSIGSRPQSQSAIPKIDDLVYKPRFLPRFASPCTLPGIILISNACGRVPR